MDRRDRLFVLGQAGYRGASSETGARRNPRDKHDTSETFQCANGPGKRKEWRSTCWVDVGIFAHFLRKKNGVVYLDFFESLRPTLPEKKKPHLESGLNQRDRATDGFVGVYTHRKPGTHKKIYRRGFITSSNFSVRLS